MGSDFIRTKVREDLESGKYARVVTRFPPEPNGFLHIGHAKSICLNFGLAEEFDGVCHLRFDDTNPTTEDARYVDAIQQDVRWLGFDWGEHLYFASDYFEQLYDYAVGLIRDGKAYVDSQSEGEIRQNRGTVTEPGVESPYRDRPVEESLELFGRMKGGEFDDGEHVLRARIDMGASNMLMRDPLLYRIRHAHHYRTGDEWCIYPMYDFAHCLSDAIEDITHSLCTLEFENNRELYDWVLDAVGIEHPRPEQTEFARLNLEYTVLSKRKLSALVRGGHVDGWDDPRMPTIAGLRKRGVTPEAIRSFCDMIGVAKVDSRVDIGKLEYALRDDLNTRVPRVMCVLRPLKVVISNYPEETVEQLDAPYYPHDVPKEGSREVPFAREIYIERDDFREDPPKGFYRLAPGREVRLRYAYIVRCEEVIKDPETGEVTEVRCTYDPATRGGSAPDGRQIKGTLHWVSASHGLEVEVREYDRLFRTPNPDETEPDEDFTSNLNPNSLITVGGARIEPSVAEDRVGTRYQFERIGYFISDPEESEPGSLVFNRTVALRDTWAKIAARSAKKSASGEKRSGPKGERKPPQEPSRAESPAPREPKGEVSSAELDERAGRYTDDLGIPEPEARTIAADAEAARLFEDAVAAGAGPAETAKWVINELFALLKDRSLKDLPFGGGELGELVAMVESGEIPNSIAKQVLEELATGGGRPRDIMERENLRPLSDAQALKDIIDRVMTANPDKVKAYRGGQTGLLGFFMGQIMRESEGRADPEVAKALLREKL